jgi:hypothetical protein
MPTPPVGFVAHVRVSTYLYYVVHKNVYLSEICVSTTGYFLNIRSSGHWGGQDVQES